MKDLIIVGIQDSHDAAACITRNGTVLAAVAEERLLRIKSAGGFPAKAVEECLRISGLKKSDVDYVAVAGTRAVPVNLLSVASSLKINDYYRIQEKVRYPNFYEGKNIPLAEGVGAYKPTHDVHYDRKVMPLKETRELSENEKNVIASYRHSFIAEYFNLSKERVIFYDHHACHALYAMFSSPFREETVCSLTMDAGGDGVYDTVNIFDQKGLMKNIHRSHECLIGPLYTYITLLLGMRPCEHEYKVMGLAPYAKSYLKKSAYNSLSNMIVLDGFKFSRNPQYKDIFWAAKEALKTERFDGIAGGLQDLVEDLLTRWVEAALRKTQARKLVYSGGVALNVKANQKIAEIPGLEQLFIPPGCGDESLPMGAAWGLYAQLCREQNKTPEILPMESAYLGSKVTNSDVEHILDMPLIREKFVVVEGDPEISASQALADGHILAVCRDSMEFGPRSLGHRSLLADPRRPESVQKINEAIKGRDFWMPFAPSVLKEDANRYLDMPSTIDLRFMTCTVDSTAEGKATLVSCLHPYDGTARPQIVTQTNHSRYYDLIKKFKDKTGVGAVLNTSLNIHGKPIVSAPREIAEEILSDPKVTLSHLLVGNCFLKRA